MPSWSTNHARVAKFGKRDGLKIHCPQGLAGSNPAPGTQSFGPTNESRRATLERGAMEICVGPSLRHSTQSGGRGDLSRSIRLSLARLLWQLTAHTCQEGAHLAVQAVNRVADGVERAEEFRIPAWREGSSRIRSSAACRLRSSKPPT